MAVRAARTLGAAALASVLLSACAALAPRPAESLAGRLSVRIEGDAARSFNAAFELSGSAERGHLSLATPLGVQLARAEWSPRGVLLRAKDGERSYDDLDSLAQDALGERIPLAALFDWLRGRAWPGAASETAPPGFRQLGWLVDLSRQSEGWVLAQRQAAPIIMLRVKLDVTAESVLP